MRPPLYAFALRIVGNDPDRMMMNLSMSFWFTSEQAAAVFTEDSPKLPEGLLLLKMENWNAILTSLEQQKNAGVKNVDLDARDVQGRGYNLPLLIDELKRAVSKKDLGTTARPERIPRTRNQAAG